MLNLHMNENEASDWFIAQIRDCLSAGKGVFKSIDDTMHILGQESGKTLTGQLTTLLRSKLDRLCSSASFLTPYSVELGPLLIDRCRVSGSNARPIFLVFRSATIDLNKDMQKKFRQIPGAKSTRRLLSLRRELSQLSLLHIEDEDREVSESNSPAFSSRRLGMSGSGGNLLYDMYGVKLVRGISVLNVRTIVFVSGTYVHRFVVA